MKLDKQTKQLIRQIKKHIAERYKMLVTYVLNNADSAIENVTYYIENEPHFLDIVQYLRGQEQSQARRKIFDATVHTQKSAQDYYLEYAQRELAVVREAIMQQSLQPAYASEEIAEKDKELANLNKRLHQLEVIEQRLLGAVQQLQPEKRPVGRPKKDKQKE